MKNDVIENTEFYKNMVLYMMDDLSILSDTNSKFVDPVKYLDTFQSMTLNNTTCFGKDEYKEYQIYSIFKKYMIPSTITCIPNFDNNGITTIHFYTDMRYSHEDYKWDRVSYGINISVLKDSILLVPYLDLVYMNIKSRLALVASKIYTKDSNKYTFYKVYDSIYTSIEKIILEEYFGILDTINDIDGPDDYNILKEMGILATLVYMKHIVPKDKYEEFMELEGNNIG